MNRRMDLADFQSRYAAEIVGWATSVEEARAWCGHKDDALPAPSIFESWHADSDVHPYVLVRDGAPVAYGELWVDDEEGEIELARLIVRPSDRGRGVGRRLVEELIRKAAPFGFAQAYLRVLPGNGAAIACYLHAGFTRVSEPDERRFNERQPVRYAWFRCRLTS